MTNDQKTLAITEAAKIVVALIQAGPGAYIGAGADGAADRAAKSFAAIFSQIEKSAG